MDKIEYYTSLIDNKTYKKNIEELKKNITYSTSLVVKNELSPRQLDMLKYYYTDIEKFKSIGETKEVLLNKSTQNYPK